MSDNYGKFGEFGLFEEKPAAVTKVIVDYERVERGGALGGGWTLVSASLENDPRIGEITARKGDRIETHPADYFGAKVLLGMAS